MTKSAWRPDWARGLTVATHPGLARMAASKAGTTKLGEGSDGCRSSGDRAAGDEPQGSEARSIPLLRAAAEGPLNDRPTHRISR